MYIIMIIDPFSSYKAQYLIFKVNFTSRPYFEGGGLKGVAQLPPPPL